MDYSSFFPPQYQHLTAANLQAANSAFSLNQSTPTNAIHQQQQQRQQQQHPSNPVSQLQQNMFFLDPFDTKLEHPQPNDLDHTSHSSTPNFHVSLMVDESEAFIDELDTNPIQNHQNHSSQNLQNNTIPRFSTATDFDLSDLNQEFMDSSTGGNTTVIHPQMGHAYVLEKESAKPCCSTCLSGEKGTPCKGFRSKSLCFRRSY